MNDLDPSLVIQGYIDCLRRGDDSARAALLGYTRDRLARLARKMLRGYPRVERWEQTDDVLQNALIRLDRALRRIVPPTAADYFCLAAAQIRRELIDLARHYSGPEGPGAHHSTRAGTDTGTADDPMDRASDETHEPGRLFDWTEFHRTVETLDENGRQVFDLLWYQGLTQAEAAQVLGLSERQVHRRWIAARLRLVETLGGQLPI